MSTKKVTEIGKYLRALRAKNNEKLVNMSERISLSPGMISGIETGKRNIPKGFASRVQSAYGLNEADAERLRFAIARTKEEAKIDLRGLSPSDAELAIRIAMAFHRLDNGQKTVMAQVLDGALSVS